MYPDLEFSTYRHRGKESIITCVLYKDNVPRCVSEYFTINIIHLKYTNDCLLLKCSYFSCAKALQSAIDWTTIVCARLLSALPSTVLFPPFSSFRNSKAEYTQPHQICACYPFSYFTTSVAIPNPPQTPVWWLLSFAKHTLYFANRV